MEIADKKKKEKYSRKLSAGINMSFSKQNTLNNTLDIESQKGKYPDEKLQQKSKRELVHTIQQLYLENERQRGVIAYQRQETQNLTNRLLDINYQEKLSTEKTDEEGTLLPLLEAMEERVIRKKTNKMHRILNDAFLNKNSKHYRIVNDIIVGLIFFSIISVTMESVPSLMDRWEAFFYWSELIVVGLFTIEYIINIYVAEDKLKYIFGAWGLIDLIAILPSYFHFMDLRDIKMAKTLRIVRFLRTIRMMRILKLAKDTTEEYRRAKQRVQTFKIDLQIYLTTLFTVITIISTLVYYAERNVPATPFTSIPASMWWCVVTITTVGYGDMHPSTFMGKLIAAISMIMGLALFGLLMNVIGKAMMTSLFGSSKLD